MRAVRGGFTLIELLVTLAILAIAMAVAVPSMLDFQRNAELTTAVNNLTSAINAARGEAMKRNQHAYVTPLTSQWSSGYTVFVDIDRNGLLSNADVTVAKQADVSANLDIIGTGTAAQTLPFIRFDGSGFTRDNAGGFANLAVTVRRRDTIGKPDEFNQTRHVMITQTGRVRTCKPASATDANCNPANP